MISFLSLLGGVGAALGHAPFHLWFVSFPALVLVFFTIAKAPTSGRAAWRGWLAGAGYFAVALHWIVEPFLVDIQTHGWLAPFALIALAGGLALFWSLAAFGAKKLGGQALTFAICLAVAEILRGHVFTGFPWAMPAYIWEHTPVMRVASFAGSYGLSTLTLIVAALLATRARWRFGQISGVFGLVGLVAMGFMAGANLPSDQSALGNVGLVHPNVPQKEKWRRDLVEGHIERLKTLTGEAAGQSPDLIVLPEVAVVYPLGQDGGAVAEISAAAGQAAVILGINRIVEDEWFNALVQISPGEGLSAVYDKVHLVPFGEYIPFRLEVLKALAATSSDGFTPGDAVRLIDTPIGRALPLICYEGIFPGHVFRAGERADYILLITNDGWFGTFAGPAQHLSQARFRAVEQGLSVVRVANRGFSTVIDPMGQSLDMLDQSGSGVSVQSVPTGRMTLYARTGDWPLFVILLFSMCALIWRNSRNTIAKRSSSA